VTTTPKAKNVAGSKRSRKGKASRSKNRELVQKFGKKVVERYPWEWFEFQLEPKYMGDEYVHEGCPTLCGVESMAWWERSKDTGRHNTLHFANFNQVSRMWLKIMCSVLLPAKHLKDVTRDMVVLVYMLMKGMSINVGAILRQNIMKFRNNMRWRFYYRGLIAHFPRAQGIEEEVMDLTSAFHLDLMGKLVDVTRTKALDTFYGPVLSTHERQARDDSVMTRMFDDEMETMAERYPLTESAAFLYRTCPAFLEPLDDDEATADEAMDNDEDNVVDEEANGLMVFDR
ncbi:hypothetical protein H5410_015466, partial [Solanum commersonii]